MFILRFSTEGLNKVLVPKIAALAGTSYADLLFTYAIAKLFKTARGLFSETGLQSSVQVDALQNVFGIQLSAIELRLVQHIFETTFVEDGAWPIYAPALKIVDRRLGG